MNIFEHKFPLKHDLATFTREWTMANATHYWAGPTPWFAIFAPGGPGGRGVMNPRVPGHTFRFHFKRHTKNCRYQKFFHPRVLFFKYFCPSTGIRINLKTKKLFFRFGLPMIKQLSENATFWKRTVTHINENGIFIVFKTMKIYHLERVFKKLYGSVDGALDKSLVSCHGLQLE